MAKYKVFNCTGWPAADVGKLDAEVERVGGGKAHGTRASRGTVLLKIFRGYLADRCKATTSQEDHPAWETFILLWDRSPKRGSRSQAWKVYRAYWEAGELPAHLDELVAAFNQEMVRPGGWQDKHGTEDEKYIPHLSTWLAGPPWASLPAAPSPPDPPAADPDDDDLELRAELLALADSFPEWWEGVAQTYDIDLQGHLRAYATQELPVSREWLVTVGWPEWWSHTLRNLKKAAKEGLYPVTREIRDRFLALVRQRLVAEELRIPGPETWDELEVALTRFPGVMRRISGEQFLAVLRAVGVPEMNLH